MSNPRNARRDGKSRFYGWRGSNFWSVTSIIDGGFPKHALKAWGIKMVAEGVIRNRPILETMFAQCPTREECQQVTNAIDLCINCNATVRFLKDLPYAHTQRAADIGTAVHTAIEAYSLGKPMPPWALAIRPRMHQFERFLKEWSPTFELAETTVYNRTYAYAGTLDAILTLPIQRVTRLVAATVGWEVPEDRNQVRLLVDWKTSQRGLFAELALQLAAYRYAEFIGLADGSEQPMVAVDGCAGLNLTNEDYRLVPVVADPAIWKAFLHGRSVFQFLDDTAKHVLGPDIQPMQALEVVA